MSEIKQKIARVQLSSVVRQFIELKKSGNSYKAVCPFHDDTDPSLIVTDSKRLWKCFSCGAGGDVLDFLVKKNNWTTVEALQWLDQHEGNVRVTEVQQKKDVKKPIHPVPDYARKPTFNHIKHGYPSQTYTYTDINGNLYGYVCRFDFDNGKKEVLPHCFDGASWRWMGFAEPRPLFNLPSLKQFPNRTVIVVEGEKTARAAINLFPENPVVTWIGGCDAIKKTDWSPLFGRKILFWPDNDEVGFRAMFGGWEAIKNAKNEIVDYRSVDGIMDILSGNCVAKAVKMDPVWPTKFDAADFTGDVNKYLESGNMIDVPVRGEKPALEVIAEEVPHVIEAPFKFLGFTKVEFNPRFIFYVHQSHIVVAFNASGLSMANLINLAPIEWWEANFPSRRASSRFDLINATNWIVSESYRRGMFNPDIIRGRGAWIEGKTVVIHTGDSLIVNNKRMTLNEHKSRYIYEQSWKLDFNIKNPLTKEEAYPLLDMLKLLNWEREVNPYLLAGWCVIAPVCGALKWRPHIWLTGAAGTGKSWTFKQIVRRLLGNCVLDPQGNSTEAGIRQMLQHDAIPVVFDEAEGESKTDMERMQNVLQLMRGSSSDDGGRTIKGSTSGMASTFKIRSCFAFASIAPQMKNMADKTRVTMLGLKKQRSFNSDENWRLLQSIYYELVTDMFVDRLQARTVSLLPVILKNSENFSAAVAIHLKSQRLGDQIGTLLAGAYSLTEENEVTVEEALEFIKLMNWNEEQGLEENKDELELFYYIMESLLQVESDYNGRQERSIGELCQICFGEFDKLIDAKEAKTKLARHGIRCEFNPAREIWISNTSKFIKYILKDTRWNGAHGTILKRLEGAYPIPHTVRFGAVEQTRAVAVPASLLGVKSNSEILNEQNDPF